MSVVTKYYIVRLKKDKETVFIRLNSSVGYILTKAADMATRYVDTKDIQRALWCACAEEKFKDGYKAEVIGITEEVMTVVFSGK